MRKLYEDFFDDNAGQLQTSLKGLTDEIDNPADDYDYVVDFYDSSPDMAEKMKDKLETILSACVAEFSEIEVNEVSHLGVLVLTLLLQDDQTRLQDSIVRISPQRSKKLIFRCF